ncbi:phage/plasmid primase, P4 family [Parendozoicomonas sp. Alg238-R29]|uniref:phage/plasmid primase, P4 family n=1 Tax=Parendozoicomonas sp. Alg238-R29 TaxID=2993446 RepID=UPI00248DC601|nr:phage/plasmid primase, P4 family [Parendozoicomonas sp. Alg238-R29]
MTDFLDFNDAPIPREPVKRLSVAEVKERLLERLPQYIEYLLPQAKGYSEHYAVGDSGGAEGQSLKITITGDKKGLWHDFSTGEHGDMFHLTQANQHIDFPEALQFVARWLGVEAQVPRTRSGQPKNKAPIDDLGPHSAKWDYFNDKGQLVACVYRYDTLKGKEFRPWDVKQGKYRAPSPRPLYNQPAIQQVQAVVLVEGEKCAQALIEAGICATTAMNGAKAPVHKTDWSPLKGKQILIWPDNDQAGREYAEAAAQAVLKAGALSCDILIPPKDKPEKWDAADALKELDAQENPFDVRGFITSGERTPVRLSDNASPALPAGTSLLTDDDITEAFHHLHKDNWRYCAQWGRWFVWTGQRWCPDRVLYVNHLSRELCREAAREAENDRQRTRLASNSTIQNVVKLARSAPCHATVTEDWDGDPWLLNTPGGVVDLKTGRLSDHNREDMMTRITTAAPEGECPLWLRFLNDVADGDQALVDYLQKVVGYCLTGVTTEHALFFLHGGGANGKSVFIHVLMSILGNYAVNASVETFMESRHEKHPTDLASLQGARFVSSVETEQGKRWNESKLKTLTGGDKISARFMRQDFFEYTPQFKLVIAGNHKPTIRNVDDAMKRRLHLVPFTVKVAEEKKDRELPNKLLKERNGIMAWAVAGCLRWQQEGIQPPASVVKATAEYFDGEDTLGQWLDERCDANRSHREGVSQLYNDWRVWCDDSGQYVGSVKQFSESLQTREFHKCRMSTGHRGLTGLKLRPRPYVKFGGHTVD